MTSKRVTISLLLAIPVFLSSCDNGNMSMRGHFNALPSGWNIETAGSNAMIKVAAQVESAADRLYSQSLSPIKPIRDSEDINAQSCDWENTAIVTIYSTNSRAQAEIDIKIDGYPVGSLTTYFPNDGPSCRKPGTDGVLTLKVPAGDHMLEARSLNISWPGHSFTVERCECRLLSLS